jgi:hypothetical protein
MTPIPGSSIVEGKRCYGQPRPSLSNLARWNERKKMEEKKTGGEIAKYSRKLERKI